MSAEPRSMKTEAEQGLAQQFIAARDDLPGSPAVAERRDAAFALFERLGLPHRRIEAWKYTDLRARMRKALPIAPTPSLDQVERTLAASSTFADLDHYRLVLADGYFQEPLSDREAMLAEGIEIATLVEFLGSDGTSSVEALHDPEGAGGDAMIALNAALASDGVVIRMPDGCLPSKPIEIVHVSTVGTPASAWFTRSVATIGAGAKARLLVSHVGPDGVAYRSNSFVAVDMAEAAEIAFVDLQSEGDAAQHVTTFSAELAKESKLRHLSVASGAALSRLQGFVTIKGERADLSVSGANMLSRSQHGDITWRIDHAVPGATSRVLYKSAVADTAFGAFQGLILVRAGAPKTDGKMMTRTLLLSDEAQFAAKPELEIYADDVQCGHGATIGKIDETALFYLMSRGIPRTDAEALLIRAYLAEALAPIGDKAIAASLEPILAAWPEQRAL